MTTIALRTGIRRQDVPRTIRRLEQFRLLRREPGGPTSPNVYRLAFDDDAAVSATPATGVRNNADRVSANRGSLVSAPVRTKQPIEQPTEQLAARSACSRVRGRQTEDGANSEFEDFWRIYPHRGSFPDPKKPARLKFEAAVTRGVDAGEIIRGAENYRATVEANGTEPRYVAQALTWLNQERWNDYPETADYRLRVGMN
jgi:hypothetical protein